eukprot:7519049-Prorocentrum_lima.AAC.1
MKSQGSMNPTTIASDPVEHQPEVAADKLEEEELLWMTDLKIPFVWRSRIQEHNWDCKRIGATLERRAHSKTRTDCP